MLVAVPNSKLSVAEHVKCSFVITSESKTNFLGERVGLGSRQSFSDQFDRNISLFNT